MNATTYTSELPKDECLRRLQAQTGRGVWTRSAEGTISARIRGDQFRLFAWGRPNLRNSFAPFFYGRLERANGKTRVRGHFSMHLLVRAFFFLWFGGLTAVAGLILFLPSSEWGSGQRPPGFALLGLAVMGLLGFGLVRFGRWLGRGQAETLRLFLARDLQAHTSVEGGSDPGASPNCGPSEPLGDARIGGGPPSVTCSCLQRHTDDGHLEKGN